MQICFQRCSEGIEAGFNVNAADEKTGNTALMLAAANGHKKVCIMLLKAKAKKNLRSTTHPSVHCARCAYAVSSTR